MAEKYNYQRLQRDTSIRVLHLAPAASPDAPLQCELVDVDLDRRPSYEALSYVWGSVTPGHHVLCGGRPLPVTENCAAALRCLRRRGRRRVLWVDAICIDQASSAEKSAQVALMARIYGQAVRVLAWLGRSSNFGAAAFQHLTRLGRVSRSETAMRVLSPMLLRRLRQTSERITGSPDHLPNFIADLLNDRYFSRMWTTQEVVLSKKCLVCYGGSAMPWWDFARAALATVGAPSRGGASDGFLTMWALSGQKGEALRASSAADIVFLALALTQDRVATDPRDKIFAFYGIFKRYNVDFPRPDYSKSAATVFADAAAAAIKITKSLLILSLVNNNDRVPSLPSWAPDWRDAGFGRPVLPPQGFAYFKTREPTFSEGESRLHVFGTVFARIASCSDSYREHPIIPHGNLDTVAERVAAEQLHRVRVLQDWTRTALSLGSYPTGEDLSTAYFGTVTEGFQSLDGSSKGRAGASSAPMTDKAFYAWNRVLLLNERMYQYYVGRPDLSVPGFASADADDPTFWALSNLYATQKLGVADTWDTHNSVLSRAENRALFTTESGYLGVAFHTVRPGDLVVLLSHAGVPMIIRPASAGRYQFVAPAYVHPVSELVAAAEKGLRNLEEFVLV